MTLLQPRPTAQGCCSVHALQPDDRGSRRRRLWEFDAHAHCPVIGVCLPLPLARRLADKVLGGSALADDYELHCGLVTDCKTRTRLAEAVHKALDQRHAGALRLAAACKTSDALEAWWRARSPGAGLPGALWATLTHPQCTPGFEHQVLGEVHMRQHQVGHEHRVDHERLQTVERALGEAQAELGTLRPRAAQLGGELGAERQRAQAAEVQLRGELLARDTRIAQLLEEAETLREANPDLASRKALVAQLQAQGERLLALQRALTQAQDLLAARPKQGPATTGALGIAEAADTIDTPEPPEPATRTLEHRTVLCVGGRASAVPVYRETLERLGARFEHHDGGQEQGIQRLQACLAAADLVICQAGCVSHDAYWRVKEHCKRTGKRCVFVETPSTTGLRRALAEALATGNAGNAAEAAQAVQPAVSGSSR